MVTRWEILMVPQLDCRNLKRNQVMIKKILTYDRVKRKTV